MGSVANDIRDMAEKLAKINEQWDKADTTTIEEVQDIEETELDEDDLMEAATFQKRHYYFIADVIRDDFNGDPQMAQIWANALQGTNPNFKSHFFIDYATNVHSKKTAAGA